ncbi:uncharacterized protein LOC128676810 [Plodia interpunctella]|uniref:uncharacterized protein LOC128676810 n=1 Tax=Plodia interpunctella TaxID=58824 RepID=UPI0023686A20|nr:uncharacterized protein LOC128676810 [Plodia interpunctella]
MKRILAILALMLFTSSAHAHCAQNALAHLPYVVEHAVWRGWNQALIYTPDNYQDCDWAIVRLMKCLAVNGIASVVNPTGGARLQTLLGVVIMTPRLQNNNTASLKSLLKKLHEIEMNTASFDWLMVTRSEYDFRYINEVLNATSVRFDQNIVVVYPSLNYNTKDSLSELCGGNFIYRNDKNRSFNRRNGNNIRYYINCRNTGRSHHQCSNEYEMNYYRSSERFRNITRNKTYKKNGQVLPLWRTGYTSYNYSRTFIMTNISKFSLRQQFYRWEKRNRLNGKESGINIVQYFKVRINSTLYAFYLGCWVKGLSMSGVDPPYPVEARNFLGEKLTVGRCNGSADGSTSLEDDGPSAPTLLDDVLYFLTVRLNTTSRNRYFSKLGFRTYEGTWTGLLGALMEQTIDLALEPVTAHPSRHDDMDFIFPIAETMCNIYIRQQETSTVRDIFLAPFSARLVACVLAVAVVASLAVVLISKLAPTIKNKGRPMGFTEALIWSTGILCQQGGNWTPPNPAGSMLLIVCLLFAVVTYNAYAAFITSVLSVRVASVDTVAAVLHSPNFKIGYIRNGADQMYLMSTKDSQLNAFYIRGYSDADNLVSSAEEGLARAAKQDYAFFAGQRSARSTLRSLSQARGRCAVRELPVHSTRAQLAFPLPRRSPYARPTLVSLLQLRSTGALARLGSALVPAMPECAPPVGFASARANDVRSALLLIVSGLIAAFLLGIGEYCWKNRQELAQFLIACYRRLLNIFT